MLERSDISGCSSLQQPNTSLLNAVALGRNLISTDKEVDRKFEEQPTDRRPSLKRGYALVNLFEGNSTVDVTNIVTKSNSDSDSTLMPPPKRQKKAEVIELNSESEEILIRSGKAVRRLTGEQLFEIMRTTKILASQVTTLTNQNTSLLARVMKLEEEITEIRSLLSAIAQESPLLNSKFEKFILYTHSSVISSSSESSISINTKIISDTLKEHEGPGVAL